MIKKLTAFLFAISLSCAVSAQYAWEFGGGIGSANYLGDIGGQLEARGGLADIQLTMTRPGFTAYGRYKMFDWLGLNAGFNYGWIQGADSLSDMPTRFSRNLSFRNQIYELYGRGEIFFLRLNDVGRTGRYRLDFNAYIYAGAAVFYHNPKAYYNGEWIALQPLQTEGVRYSRIQPSIPLGGGIYFTLFRQHRFGFDFGGRYTFTDYLDDVSTVYQHPDLFTDPLAQTLADRSYEVNPDDPRFLGTEYYSRATWSDPENPGPRGGPAPDYYLMSNFTYAFVVKGKSNFSKSKYNFVTGKVRKRKSKAKF